MIYFCIPAHNEERTVGVVLWKLRQVMAELNRDYQIIVVDDASADSTPAVLSPYIRVLPLTVIRNSTRRGYADALEVAIREAVRRAPYPKRDAVITLQADFTEDPDVVQTLVKKIEAGADIVATTVDIDTAMPRPYRWGRRLFNWLLRGKEWAGFGDPLSGLRAYRVVTMKRALDTRGTGRLLSWNSWGANVELLSLTVPQSRRTDVVESTLMFHRHQRDSRFTFMDTLREVRGAASGKPNAHAPALPTDGVVATPLPLAVEQAAARQPHTERPRHRHPKVKEQPRQRGKREREQRPERQQREQREQRPKRVEKPVAPAVVAEAATTEEVKKKRRRRPRRRKEKKNQPELVPDVTTEPVASSNTEGAVPGEAPAKKKSRRGRRGGRGRRRGPRANGESNSDTQSQNEGGEAPPPPPPVAAEGD